MFDSQMIALDTIHELWHEHQGGCPHVHHDEQGCYCSSPRMPQGVDRYGPCDVYCVQVYCLDAEHYTRCCLWPSGDVP
jgi:hypothetical protein